MRPPDVSSKWSEAVGPLPMPTARMLALGISADWRRSPDVVYALAINMNVCRALCRKTLAGVSYLIPSETAALSPLVKTYADVINHQIRGYSGSVQLALFEKFFIFFISGCAEDQGVKSTLPSV